MGALSSHRCALHLPSFGVPDFTSPRVTATCRACLQVYEPIVIVAWGYATGAALTLMAIVPCALNPDSWKLSAAGVGAIFYAGLLSSALNYRCVALRVLLVRCSLLERG